MSEQVRFSLASPAQIRSWSSGEVKTADTLNDQTRDPVNGGLFCPTIFGSDPVDHRSRMGHVELAVPVVHPLFALAFPNRLCGLLGLTRAELQRIIYYQDHVVLDPGPTPLRRGTLLDDPALDTARDVHSDAFFAETGGEGVLGLLQQLDLDALVGCLRQELRERPSDRRSRELVDRLRIALGLRDSGQRPEWLVLDCLPVVPVGLRPLVDLPDGTHRTSDLNLLYRRVILRNNRLKRLVELNAPWCVMRCEKRNLQHTVDALFDNTRPHHPVLGNSNRPLRSLADHLRGPFGGLRTLQRGKRVDFSARSVVVPDPALPPGTCGLPWPIAVTLYQPFVLGWLQARDGSAISPARVCRRLLRPTPGRVDDVLALGERIYRGLLTGLGGKAGEVVQEAMRGRPVVLMRQPTLGRNDVVALDARLVSGSAVRVPLAVGARLGLTYAGEQLVVHLPLSIEAQREANERLRPAQPWRDEATGPPLTIPDEPVVVGAREQGPRRPLDLFRECATYRRQVIQQQRDRVSPIYQLSRLAAVTRDVIISQDDCRTRRGVNKPPRRSAGRVAVEDITDPLSGRLLVRAGELIDPESAWHLEEGGRERILVRGPLLCRAFRDTGRLCAACYGLDLASGLRVRVGENVGVRAALVIASAGAPLQGLPLPTSEPAHTWARLPSLWEACVPELPALLKRRDGLGLAHDLLLHHLRQAYLARTPSFQMADIHLEVVLAGLFDRVQVRDCGDTHLVPDAIVRRGEARRANSALAEGQRPALVRRVVCGLTAAAWRPASVLAELQRREPTRVLADAALRGACDPLAGLAENVLIGRSASHAE